VTDSYSTPPQASPAPNPFNPSPDLAPPPAPVVPPNAKPRGRGARIVNVVLALAVAVAIAGVAFAVGRGTANASTPEGNGRGQFFNGQGFPGNGNAGNGDGNGGGGGFVGNGGPFAGGAAGIVLEGTVSSVDADSITIKTAAGAEITVSTSGDTTYHQQAAATSSDVKTGSTVRVQVDGFRGGRFGGGPNASPAASGAPRGNASATDITVVP
jgi:hypothetical protein